MMIDVKAILGCRAHNLLGMVGLWIILEMKGSGAGERNVSGPPGLFVPYTHS